MTAHPQADEFTIRHVADGLLTLAISDRASYAAANADTSAGGLGSSVTHGAHSRATPSGSRLFVCAAQLCSYGRSRAGGVRPYRFHVSGLPTRTVPLTPLGSGMRTFRPHTWSSKMTALTLGTSAIRELDGLYSLNDLHQAAGGEDKHAPFRFMRLDTTKALIEEIAKSPEMVVFKMTQGRNGGTYACRELVIAYAAWISPAFHLKVIRVFLAATTPQQHDPIDARALLLEGGSTPTVTLPPEIEQAVMDKTWELSREAHNLIYQHLRRRVASHAETGHPQRTINATLAMKALSGHTLGDALAHTYHSKLNNLIEDAEMFSRMASDLAKAMQRVQVPIAEKATHAISPHRE